MPNCHDYRTINPTPITKQGEIWHEQEGQHPLTGQRAANFRRDLGATQDFNWWLLGKPVFDCMFAVIKLLSISFTVAALRRSVCNARASNGGRSFAFRYQGNGATPCQYIDTTRKAIDCATTLPLTVFIQWKFAEDFSSFIVEIVRKTTNSGIWSPF